MNMIAISTNCIEIEIVSFTDLTAYEFDIINAIDILKQFSSIFYTKYHMISNFVGTMACFFNLNHLT